MKNKKSKSLLSFMILILFLFVNCAFGNNFDDYRIDCSSRENIINESKRMHYEINQQKLPTKNGNSAVVAPIPNSLRSKVSWNLAFRAQFIDTRGAGKAQCEITVAGLPPHEYFPINATMKSGNTLTIINEAEAETNFRMMISAFPKYVKLEAPAKKRYFNIDIIVGEGAERKKVVMLPGAKIPVLYNRKGRVYPTWRNPDTFQTVPFPQLNWVSIPLQDRMTLDATQRKQFLTAHESIYYGGKEQNWFAWEVHHARPSQFGGTNNYSNLYPLLASGNLLHGNVHGRYSAWFAGY